MKVNSHKAFTLMELLIVVTIIGILTVIGLGSYRSSQAKARDTKRKADISNVSKALTMYYNDHGRFPEANDGEIMGAAWGGEFSSLEGVIYMKKLPSDPINNVEYIYETDENGSYYRLYTILENPNDAVYEIYQCAEGEECNYCIASSNKSCIPVIASGPSEPTSAPTSIPSPTEPTILKANGEICSTGSECESTYCYVDTDDDRYAPSSGTKMCRASSQLSGVDCCDTEANTYPGQTAYYTSQNACSSWDWNCSGSIEKSGCTSIGVCSYYGTCDIYCGVNGATVNRSNCAEVACGATTYYCKYSYEYGTSCVAKEVTYTTCGTEGFCVWKNAGLITHQRLVGNACACH